MFRNERSVQKPIWVISGKPEIDKIRGEGAGLFSATVFPVPDALTLWGLPVVDIQPTEEQISNRECNNQFYGFVVLVDDRNDTVAIPSLDCVDSPGRPAFKIACRFLGMETVVGHTENQRANAVYVSCVDSVENLGVDLANCFT